MNPALLRKILTWAAPFIIGFIVKKFEKRQAEKQMAKEYQIQNGKPAQG